jgi:hypothetical protein
MENPLIVLVDVENALVHLFGRFNRSIPLHSLYLIKPFLEGNSVLWVSDVIPAEGEDAFEMIAAVAEQVEPPPFEPMYLRCKLEGYQRVPDIKLTFNGAKDAKALDKLGMDVFERSPKLTQMLLDGDVELLTENEVRLLRKPQKDLAKAKDEQLDSILIDNHESANEVDNIFTGDNDIDPDDDKEYLTEEEEMIRKGYGKRE